jgi:uncharacterized cupin superfamily protein
MTDQPTPVRRIVAGDDESGKAVIFSDGPSPDVHTDPARPGFASTRLWVTNRTPARVQGVRETLDAPHALEPPKGGSVCRYVTYPPENGYLGGVTETHVRDYFTAMGSPRACAYAPDAPHPYMQQIDSLDFCHILDGEITLVLDTEEVHLKAGDSVVQRGARHAWSNRSDKACTIIFCSHDGG